MPDATPVPLADAIRDLREQLSAALEEGKEADLQFRLGPIEMELQMELATGAKGSAGGKLWFVSLGGEASRSSGRTHTVRLTLTPVDASGADLTIASPVPERPR